MAAILQNPRQPVPWNGPTTPLSQADQIPVARDLQNNNVGVRPAAFPFKPATDENPNIFPPVCLRSHWDPTMIIQRTLPQQQVSTPLDPRPWTKVCLNYVTSAEFHDAPRPADSVVFPSGGSVYPPTRYREAIDDESELRRLDRPLGTCERDQYIPPRSGDMYRAGVTVPDRGQPSSRFIQELAFPQACMRAGVYDCVEDAQNSAFSRSPRIFNNTTKQDRYAVQRKDLVRPQQTPGPIPTSMVSLS